MFGAFNNGMMEGWPQMGDFSGRVSSRIEKFEDYFRCYPVAMMPGATRENVNYGGKIILPPSALDKLTRLNITYPMLFELRNEETGRTTHGGVLEFIAEQGRAYLPQWMMETLGIDPGGLLVISSCSLPSGTFSKIEPQSVDFLEISDPKAVLENALRNFSCLTVDDIVQILYNEQVYAFKVLEVKPDLEHHSISVVETDLEVDFAPPVGYVDPTPSSVSSRSASALAGSMSSLGVGGTGSMASAIGYNDLLNRSRSPAVRSAMSGEGHRLTEKPAKQRETPIKTEESPSSATPLDELALEGPPLPLNLPFGQLFFGFPVIPVQNEGDAQDKESSNSSNPFAGTGQTLRANRKRKDTKQSGSDRRKQSSPDVIVVDD